MSSPGDAHAKFDLSSPLDWLRGLEFGIPFLRGLIFHHLFLGRILNTSEKLLIEKSSSPKFKIISRQDQFLELIVKVAVNCEIRKR